MATDKTPAPVMPDIANMSAAQLQEFVNAANARIKEEADKAAAEARKAAMEQVKAGLTNISAALKAAGEGIEAGDSALVVQNLTNVVTLAQAARSTIAPQATRPVRGGNGTARASRIRDQILEVFAANGGIDFSPTELSHELPLTDRGTAVSSGAISNALEGTDGTGGMIAAGLAVRTQDAPKRFRGVTQTPVDVPTE
jgi:hypothetical protein